jgi:hypothetical protein
MSAIQIVEGNSSNNVKAAIASGTRRKAPSAPRRYVHKITEKRTSGIEIDRAEPAALAISNAVNTRRIVITMDVVSIRQSVRQTIFSLLRALSRVY